MKEILEYATRTPELRKDDYSVGMMNREILELSQNNIVVPETTVLSLAKEILNIQLSHEEILAFGDYYTGRDEAELVPLALRAIEQIAPSDIDNFPMSKQQMINGYISTSLRPLVHFIDSLKGEIELNKNPTEDDVRKILLLESSCSLLLNNKPKTEKLEHLTNEEIINNNENLSALSELATEQGAIIDTNFLMHIQPTIFEMLTSNDAITTSDVNYRKRLGSTTGAARSLQAPERPNTDKLLSRYGSYIDFIEATATTKRGGYASTFGFLHRIHIDETGNPYILENPHTMYDEDILNIDHPIADRLKSFENDFNRTHDMLHNALPVYADHFMIHHPSAPITLGGYLPDYELFGKNIRKDKSSYELGLAILHKQIMHRRFEKDPELLNNHVSVARKIMDDLYTLQVKNEISQRVVDHTSFVIMSAVMNIIDINDDSCKKILDSYDRLSLPATTVSPKDVYRLLIQQEVIDIDESLIDRNNLSMNKDEIISNICKRVTDDIAIKSLRDLEINFDTGEQGAECIVRAIYELGINPAEMSEPIVLQKRDRLRWTGITASSRRLKGFNEKVHGLDSVRFWDDKGDKFINIPPVKLLEKFHNHFKDHADEYKVRTEFRSLSNKVLCSLKEFIFDDSGVFNSIATDRRLLVSKAIDACVHSLINDLYTPVNTDTKVLLSEIIAHLDSSGYTGVAKKLNSSFCDYETLVEAARHLTESNGATFSEAKKVIEQGLMSLDG